MAAAATASSSSSCLASPMLLSPSLSSLLPCSLPSLHSSSSALDMGMWANSPTISLSMLTAFASSLLTCPPPTPPQPPSLGRPPCYTLTSSSPEFLYLETLSFTANLYGDTVSEFVVQGDTAASTRRSHQKLNSPNMRPPPPFPRVPTSWSASSKRHPHMCRTRRCSIRCLLLLLLSQSTVETTIIAPHMRRAAARTSTKTLVYPLVVVRTRMVAAAQGQTIAARATIPIQEGLCLRS